MNQEELKLQLENVLDKVKECTKKMSSSTKFIDFFVHDMLDYTILKNSSKIFMKNIVVSNINDVVNEVTDILIDKLNMMEISLDLQFFGFNTLDHISQYLIKTDWWAFKNTSI